MHDRDPADSRSRPSPRFLLRRGKSAMTHEELAGCRVLVVEDETLIAFEIEAALEAHGCAVVGPVSTLECALQLARGTGLDAAILDVTIRGGRSYPVAEQLLARGIPFVLASGCGDWALPDALRDQRRLAKPFTVAELEEQVRFLCGEVAKHARAAERTSNGQRTNQKGGP
jgi:DNA-binding response OmpR family regulator